jgi:hypothetical protein
MMDELQHRAVPGVAARFEVLLLQNMVSFKTMLELIDCSNIERAYWPFSTNEMQLATP